MFLSDIVPGDYFEIRGRDEGYKCTRVQIKDLGHFVYCIDTDRKEIVMSTFPIDPAVLIIHHAAYFLKKCKVFNENV